MGSVPTLQAKLKVSKPGDQYEQEADRVAEEVMRMRNAKNERRVKPLELKGTGIPAQFAGVSSDIESRIRRTRRGGQPLPETMCAFFELQFGYEFSGVRLHTGAESDRLNRALGARAFAYGSDIYLAQGASQSDQRLIAHELTHVVQQTQKPGSSIIQRFCEDCILRELHPMPDPQEATSPDQRRSRERALELRRERLREMFRQPMTLDEVRSLLDRLSIRREGDTLSQRFFDVLASGTREDLRTVLSQQLEYLEASRLSSSEGSPHRPRVSEREAVDRARRWYRRTPALSNAIIEIETSAESYLEELADFWLNVGAGGAASEFAALDLLCALPDQDACRVLFDYQYVDPRQAARTNITYVLIAIRDDVIAFIRSEGEAESLMWDPRFRQVLEERRRHRQQERARPRRQIMFERPRPRRQAPEQRHPAETV
jgi:hypothetical protein